MAVPKRKVSPTKRGNRRSHDKETKANYMADPTTGALKRRHHVSPDGYHNGRQVTDSKVNV